MNALTPTPPSGLQWAYTVDPKGRIYLPQPLREWLAPRPVAALADREGALLVVPQEVWERIATGQAEGVAWRQPMRCSLCPTDRSGGVRLSLPEPLRERAGLETGTKAILVVRSPVLLVVTEVRWLRKEQAGFCPHCGRAWE